VYIITKQAILSKGFFFFFFFFIDEFIATVYCHKSE